MRISKWWKEYNDIIITWMLVGVGFGIIYYATYIWWICPD